MVDDNVELKIRDRVEVRTEYIFDGTIVKIEDGHYFIVADGDTSFESDCPYPRNELTKLPDATTEDFVPTCWICF